MRSATHDHQGPVLTVAGGHFFDPAIQGPGWALESEMLDEPLAGDTPPDGLLKLQRAGQAPTMMAATGLVHDLNLPGSKVPPLTLLPSRVDLVVPLGNRLPVSPQIGTTAVMRCSG